MAASEPKERKPVPLAGSDGYFTQKEAAVISALMDYFGIERLTYRTALGFLAFIRTLHDGCRTL